MQVACWRFHRTQDELVDEQGKKDPTKLSDLFERKRRKASCAVSSENGVDEIRPHILVDFVSR